MSKQVLMTGADGFIGSNVLQYLLNNTNWEFTIICSWRHMGNPLNVPLNDRIKVITHDLRGPIPELGDFDYIIHLASESHVDRSNKDPVNFFENNISITLQILEYARFHKHDKFIHFSTDEVYGPRQHSDWDLLLGTSPYAGSKGAQECAVICWFYTFGVRAIITNSNNVIGKNQHPEKYVPKLIRAIEAGETVEVHQQNGKFGRRYYNPVENVASALHFILEQTEWAMVQDEVTDVMLPPRYGLHGGEELDNFQMAQLIAKVLGKPLKYIFKDPKDIRPSYDHFYPESLDYKLQDLGWQPPYDLEKGLQWIKSQ